MYSPRPTPFFSGTLLTPVPQRGVGLHRFVCLAVDGKVAEKKGARHTDSVSVCTERSKRVCTDHNKCANVCCGRNSYYVYLCVSVCSVSLCVCVHVSRMRISHWREGGGGVDGCE